MQIAYSAIKLKEMMTNHFGDNPHSIGFVPTMGALHDGHLSLIKKAKETCNVVVCSIFVNPIQFNNDQDFLKYPNLLEQDLALLAEVGCDLVFLPSVDEIYPQKPILKMDFGHLETVLEGMFRPGHFSGVGIVVSKLFNMVKPNHAFFGLKDLQQCAVVNQLVKDLGFDLQLHFMPTFREANGLAMSSRNKRLSEKGKELAANIYKSLQAAQNHFQETGSIINSKKLATEQLSKVKEITLEYFEFVDFDTFTLLEEELSQNMAVCVACYLEEVRLIDNVLI